MRALILSLVAAGAVAGVYSDEPSEREMRNAFEGTLALQVRNALDFASESGGSGAVARIRDNGMDRFAVNSFRKLDCARDAKKTGYVCTFIVDLGLANGAMQGKITGRFMPAQAGYVFSGDA